jgi:hypothetical protein
MRLLTKELIKDHTNLTDDTAQQVTLWYQSNLLHHVTAPTLKGDLAILRGALLGLTMVFPKGFSRPTGDSRYGDSVGGPALGLSASPVLNLNIFFAPGLHSRTSLCASSFGIKRSWSKHTYCSFQGK